jgi:hypothetical protein
LETQLLFNSKINKVGFYIGGNASFYSNKILNMEEPEIPEDYLYAKGRPINQPYVLEAIGFFKDQNEINNSPQQLFGNVQPGDVKYRDRNNDKVIDDRDRFASGNTAYPNVYYGINSGLNFKGFDFNIFFQGAAERTVSLLDNQNIVPFLNGGVRPSQWVKDNYWTPERGDAAKFPRLTTEANDNNYRASTLWQRDGSYLRLKNVEIGYTIPARLTRKIRVSNMRVHVSGNNLFTWDKIDEIDVDPEIMNQFVHPSFKSYNFGLSLNL